MIFPYEAYFLLFFVTFTARTPLSLTALDPSNEVIVFVTKQATVVSPK